jgi:hypothetical protein
MVAESQKEVQSEVALIGFESIQRLDKGSYNRFSILMMPH